MDDMNVEWRRLQGLYAGLGDAELLDLVRDRDGLTEVAQRAVDAEVVTRGLALPVEEQTASESDEDTSGDDDTPETRLFRFSFAGDAESAVGALEEEGISSRIGQPRERNSEGGPDIAVAGLDLWVSTGDQASATQVLRRKMGLFPSAEVESQGDLPGEASFLGVGIFDIESDADRLVEALSRAGITALKSDVPDAGMPLWDVGVDFDDLETAQEVAEKLSSQDNSE